MVLEILLKIKNAFDNYVDTLATPKRWTVVFFTVNIVVYGFLIELPLYIAFGVHSDILGLLMTYLLSVVIILLFADYWFKGNNKWKSKE